jgi:hypothetical protein
MTTCKARRFLLVIGIGAVSPLSAVLTPAKDNGFLAFSHFPEGRHGNRDFVESIRTGVSAVSAGQPDSSG